METVTGAGLAGEDVDPLLPRTGCLWSSVPAMPGAAQILQNSEPGHK